MAVFESSGTTHIEVVKIKYKWTINNFSCSSKKVGEAIHSPIFCGGTGNDKTKWYLALYPFGLDENSLQNMTVRLHLVSFYSRELKAKYMISILNAKGKESNTLKYSATFIEKQAWGCSLGITRNSLLTKSNDFLPNDRLTISCCIIATVGSVNTSTKSITLQNCLEKDFASLLKNPVHSDFILCVGDKGFKTHKAILAARSPVFKSMFESNMRESETNRVEIEEPEEVVCEMLRYIYTEKASKKMATELLPLADRYLLDGLKIMCEQAMCESLSIENCVQFFILGNMYRANQLKAQAKGFISAHAADLLKTIEFISMLQENPNLSAEIFSSIVN